MSADALGGVHLLPAGEAFQSGYPNTRIAVCGEPVTSAPDGDEADPGYCADCVLADDAPTLTNAELRARLMALAGRAVMRFR